MQSKTPPNSNALQERHEVWKQKPILRHIYGDIFDRIKAECVSGRTLEVGGGSGMAHDFIPDAITSDILPTPWTDVTCDCQNLPFPDSSFENIILVDVLHHVESPLVFLREAYRVLSPGGRLVMSEPAMTLVSRPFYSRFHVEPVDMNADPCLIAREPNPNRNPLLDANQAIPTLLLGKYRDALSKEFPDFPVLKFHHFSLWAYPLSGGFRPWSLLPTFLVPILLKLERLLEPLLGRLLGFRLLAVLEKTSKNPNIHSTAHTLE